MSGYKKNKEPRRTKGKKSLRAYQYHQNLVKQLKEGSVPDFHEIDQRHRHSPFASFRWAFRGLYYAFWTQRNFRIELLFATIVIALGLYFPLNKNDWSWILLSIFQVLGAELMNTALEYMVDIYEKKFNSLAMMAKDIAAAFVLLSAIHAATQGVFVFGPYILRLF
ncbi:MAG: diacylglycerol kinase family protein [Spirochaetota bacterium]